MENGYVNVEVEKGIASIEFGHPKSNSLPGHILKKLSDTINSLNDHSDCRVIILKSGGNKAFCAGASFDELLAIDQLEKGKTFFMGFANVINAMRKSKCFVIGRIQGKAVGGGVGLACACDYSLATNEASLKLSELDIGIGPFVVGPAVMRKAGVSGLSHLGINASEWQDASWGLSRGIYNELSKSIEELDNKLLVLANKLSSYNPLAMTALKNSFWVGCEDWDQLLEKRAEISGQLVLSNFTRNAIQKFQSKG